MKSLAICLFLLSAVPKSTDTVESVRKEWVERFRKDPAGQVEIFHATCIARPQCPDEEVYTLGIALAGMETGHPVMWMAGGSNKDDPKYVLVKP